ncbi:DUF1801 domain-containing protein [Teredinibacter franksiae]|uniref:DUF1801 domain-containing protein n=1 Tax=Teredinibacter franksiae TaxID=2761453 RepID=UPI001629AB47|nr:DUF1801 domain-containing protein [Teredinibacter franksiae]
MDIDVKEKFDSYPADARKLLLEIRSAIITTAAQEGVGNLIETLKWGEPSYIAKKGSTVRIDWKPKNPDKVSIFFSCKTNLIETFREIYGDRIKTVGNREIEIPISAFPPMPELRACLSMALRYHTIKHLPLLGA